MTCGRSAVPKSACQTRGSVLQSAGVKSVWAFCCQIRNGNTSRLNYPASLKFHFRDRNFSIHEYRRKWHQRVAPAIVSYVRATNSVSFRKWFRRYPGTLVIHGSLRWIGNTAHTDIRTMLKASGGSYLRGTAPKRRSDHTSSLVRKSPIGPIGWLENGGIVVNNGRPIETVSKVRAPLSSHL